MAQSLPTLSARRDPLSAPAEQLRQLSALPLEASFEGALEKAGLAPFRPTKIEILQLNLGKMCNQTCRHCHVDAGPDRTEMASRETLERSLAALERSTIPTVDITGGAPELNPHFRWLVERCRDLGRHVIDRCNLTILEVARFRDLPEFFAKHQVEVVCSLPHFRELSTDAQRGRGVYASSIRALRRLNEVGYGQGDPARRLVVVTNPVGAFLPGKQESLEVEWKRELQRLHGVCFDALYCITNMPISRYLEWLKESGNLETYMQRLVSSFNPAAAQGAMCRTTLSVGWEGTLYDCDFNQMLELPASSAARRIEEFDLQALEERQIVTGPHCFGCSAGAGSSCGGRTT